MLHGAASVALDVLVDGQVRTISFAADESGHAAAAAVATAFCATHSLREEDCAP